MRRIWAGTAVVAALVAGLLAGCGSPGGVPTITVFAAASLRPTFTELAEQFKADNPGVVVELSFGGSSDLATQLTEGADADVFASANAAQMGKVADAGLLADGPVPFATNTLVIVTAPGNPHRIASFADLAAPGLAVVVCQQQVPCGAATHRIEDATAVRINPVSEESEVTDVLNKVATGQADAGLVYRTDAGSAGPKVTAIEFPQSADAVNTYPVAALKRARHPALAHKFVDLVTGDRGQRVLGAAGFGKP